MESISFDDALKGFVKGCQDICDNSNPGVYTISIEPGGRKYVKLVSGGYGRSVHCFVEKATGNVLKAATWASPAKGVRGNIYNDDNGLGRMQAHGPEYNK